MGAKASQTTVALQLSPDLAVEETQDAEHETATMWELQLSPDLAVEETPSLRQTHLQWPSFN